MRETFISCFCAFLSGIIILNLLYLAGFPDITSLLFISDVTFLCLIVIEINSRRKQNATSERY